MGEPKGGAALTEQELRKFWERVQKAGDSDCWEWQGSIANNGYGFFRMRGKRRLAHRVSMVIQQGALGAGECVLHRCDNRRCVNPNHLWIGSIADNNADCARKNRTARGGRNGAAVLDAEVVRSVHRRYAGGETQAAIADDLGVHRTTVHLIVRGKTWGHIYEEVANG